MGGRGNCWRRGCLTRGRNNSGKGGCDSEVFGGDLEVTAQEVLTLAERHTEDEVISFGDGGKEWLNSALETLSADAGVYSTNSALSAEAKTFYNFAASGHTPLDVVEVCDSNKEIYIDFDVRANQIRFADAGTYSVTYRRLPEKITTEGQTLDVHELFKHPLALFVASRFKSSGDEKNPDAVRLMQEFWAELGRVKLILRRQARRPAIIQVWRW